MELAFQCRRGTADTARTGRDRKQTEYRGSPRSLCEWLTFELPELAGPLTSWVTWREFLNLPAPASGLDKEQETVVARGGGLEEPPASQLPLHSTLRPRLSCCCVPREPSQIYELNTTVSFLCGPPGPHLSLSEVPFTFSCASRVFVSMFSRLCKIE